MPMTPVNIPEARQKLAIVSIYCSKKLDMTDFTANMIGTINSLANSEDFDLRPFVDKLH